MKPSKSTASSWLGSESPVAQRVERTSRNQLEAYKAHPPLVEEHANIERAMVEGGYGRKQLYELVQNGADELIDTRGGGQIVVVLTERALYCANEGSPITPEGAETILASHLSKKSGVEIGRFGLGFKSVLGVSSRPEVFSRSGSFGFDTAANARRIKKALPDEESIPTLRLGSSLDPRAAASDDDVLAELMEWATTVIRLTRDVGDTGWLRQDLASFPAQFLIFSPHVRKLVLDDREQSETRTITLEPEDDRWFRLGDDGSHSRWRVSKTIHHPSDAAKKDGGYSADRDQVPIYWAVPEDSMRLGELWAFFPTGDRTTLRGILNAPWKLSPDRTGLLEGRFNEELLDAAAGLVIENLPASITSEDPGAVLEIIPARGRETRGWADETIGEQIYDLARVSPSLPDQSGELELPATLVLHPGDIPEPALLAWAAVPTRPANYCHHTVDSRNRTVRRSRVVRLIDEGSGGRASLSQWLEALIDHDDLVASSAAAVGVAALCLETRDLDHERVRSAEIVLTADGRLIGAASEEIFVPGDEDVELTVPTVHPELAADSAAHTALRALGIPLVSPASVLDARLADPGLKKLGADWTEIWTLVRQCTRDQVGQVFTEHGLTAHDINVRSVAGTWSRLSALLLPGAIVPLDAPDDDDRSMTVDTDWHGPELNLFRDLGATEGPIDDRGNLDEPWFDEYRREMVARFTDRLKGQNVADTSLEFDGLRPRFAGPLRPLEFLSAEAGGRFASEALRRSADRLTGIRLVHRTNKKIPPLDVPHPIVWFIQRRDSIPTSGGPVAIKNAVGPGLVKLKSLLPVAEIPDEAANALGLPQSLDELTDAHWESFLAGVGRLDRADLLPGLYALSAQHRATPAEIRAVVGKSLEFRTPSEVAAATDDGEIRVLGKSGKPHLPCSKPEDASILIERWGLQCAQDLISSEVTFIAAREAEAIIDVFPLLGSMLNADRRKLVLQDCDELGRDVFTDTGREHRPLTFELEDTTVYRLAGESDTALLRWLSAHLDLGWEESDVQDILEHAEAEAATELMRKMRAAASDPERLLLAVPADLLRQRLPLQLLNAYEEIHGVPDDVAIAQLTLAADGFESLAVLEEPLREAGLTPPSSWSGSRRAIEFVSDLGFDRGYAGFAGASREETLDVDGPMPLPPLHDYQVSAAASIREVLSGSGGLRGVLSLPTGAGKTRVTVTALVEAMKDETIQSPVLWVAQSDELCEQAVEGWAEVWRAEGPPRPLRLSRLWSTRSAAPADEGDQVVVCTIDKLTSSCIGNSDYDWLKSASAVIVDEAHTSVTTGYTQMLEWQGMDRGRERAPLIGLSATPFRGVSEEETRRLAARYGNRRLEFDAFKNPSIELLQERGILAKVDHQVLDGADVPLTPEELAELTKFRRLPASVLSKISENVNRNRRLVESILSLDESWPVLVFAASVPHAQTLAALLQNGGRTAAAISGKTKSSLRRYAIDQFKAGELQVLTNYGVLTQGFDAPSVRALYVARPTYSPNLYQQMVGRGLRGPLNGGKERCLVVNVSDNLEQYGEKLAFTEFDHLWTS